MRLLTETQHDLLVSALDSHRKQLEELASCDTTSNRQREELHEEHKQVKTLHELLTRAGVVTLFDHK